MNNVGRVDSLIEIICKFPDQLIKIWFAKSLCLLLDVIPYLPMCLELKIQTFVFLYRFLNVYSLDN